MPEQKTQEIICCENPLEFKVKEGWADWQSHRPEMADCNSCEAKFEKKPGASLAYKKSKDSKIYQCTNCDGEILKVNRAHPIHDGPFPLSGSGSCEYEPVPYCPNCEEEPSATGSPITHRLRYISA